MTHPLIETADIRKSFPVRPRAFARPLRLNAVNGISFRLSEGETLGLAGESGSGKSTLGKLLLGLLRPDHGEVIYRGTPLHLVSGRDLLGFRKEVQMIFQDPFSSLNPRMRVGDAIAEPLLIHGLAKPSSCTGRVSELLEKVGLSQDHYHRYPHEFSGGQRQRIGIARALAVSPRLLIADEPVSALDLSIQAQIINLLQDLKKHYELSLIIIAHDLSVLRHMCDRIAVMYLGRIVEAGTTDALFGGVLHPYTEALLAAIPGTGKTLRQAPPPLKGDMPNPIAPPPGCPFHTRCPYSKPETCAAAVPVLEEKEPGHSAACHFSKDLFRK
jgi:peptide/nickel transport system ATP-binding protein